MVFLVSVSESADIMDVRNMSYTTQGPNLLRRARKVTTLGYLPR